MKHLANSIKMLGQDDIYNFELEQDPWTLERLQDSIESSKNEFYANVEKLKNVYEASTREQHEHFNKALATATSTLELAKELEAEGRLTYDVKQRLDNSVTHLEQWIDYPKDCYLAIHELTSDYAPMLTQLAKKRLLGQEAFGLITQLAKELDGDSVEMEIASNSADPRSPEAETFICNGEIEVLDYNETTLTVDIDWINYEAEKGAGPLTYTLQDNYLIRDNVRILVDNLSQAVRDIEEDLIQEAYSYTY